MSNLDTVTLHTEPNDWSLDILPRGRHAARWEGYYLVLSECQTRVPTTRSLPGTLRVIVEIDDSITVYLHLWP